MLTVGSLFAGIGGFDLGFERAGMTVIWQAEIEPFRASILRKHWPHVPLYDDVRVMTAENTPAPDLLCGGFPCSDISDAGTKTGIDGERSGLWSEIARLTGELRPRYLVVENVAALLGRGLGRVLGDLAEIGYDAEWDCLPAAAFGAPHRRDRIFIVAYPDSERCPRRGGIIGEIGRPEPANSRLVFGARPVKAWPAEPGVARMAHGVPQRVDRTEACGRAVVPQVSEWIGRRIIQAEEEHLERAA